MLVTEPIQRPIGSDPPRAPRRIRVSAETIVGALVDDLGTYANLSDGGPVSTDRCVRMAMDLLGGARPLPSQIARLEVTAAGWAREGIPLDAVMRNVHSGLRVGITTLSAASEVRAVGPEVIARRVDTMVEMLDLVTTIIATAYVRQASSSAVGHDPVRALVTALLAGSATHAVARRCGVEIAPGYAVLAVHLPTAAHRGPKSAGIADRLRRALTSVCGAPALALLDAGGGTILLPSPAFPDHRLDDLLRHLSHNVGAPITASVVSADLDEVPGAADRAHHLLDIVLRLGYPAGTLYRPDQMALEIQLSRPGPAREKLAAYLHPLRPHPQLLELLEVHLRNDRNRRITADHFHIHTNTVDHRLKRIARLTGLDPASGDGAWMLQSALTAHAFEPAPASEEGAESPDRTWAGRAVFPAPGS